jgi:16S rRNA (uracil1498-N3)-methyltransferase
VPLPGPRLIVESLPGPGEIARVAAAEAAHARARRLSEGEPVVLIDGSGREAAGRIVRAGRAGLDVRVESVSEASPDAAPALHVLVAGVRMERLCWIAEKAAELGASRLTVVATERTQSFRARDGLLPRLERIVRESAKQAGASRFTAVAGPVELAAALAVNAPVRLLLDPTGIAFPSRLARGPAALLVGPEGGFTDAERAAARETGWVTVALPAGVVRAETAAIAGIVLTRAALLRHDP